MTWNHAIRVNRENKGAINDNSCVIQPSKVDPRDLAFYHFDKGNVDWIPKNELVEQLNRVVHDKPYIVE